MKAVVPLRCLCSSYNAGKDDSSNINSENMLPLNRLQPYFYLLPKLCFASTVCSLSSLKKQNKCVCGEGERGRKEIREHQKMQRVLAKMNIETQVGL